MTSHERQISNTLDASLIEPGAAIAPPFDRPAVWVRVVIDDFNPAQARGRAHAWTQTAVYCSVQMGPGDIRHAWFTAQDVAREPHEDDGEPLPLPGTAW